MTPTPEQNERILRFMSADAQAKAWRDWAICGWCCFAVAALTIIILLCLWPN